MSSILRGSFRPSIYGGTFNAITNLWYQATKPSGKRINGVGRLPSKLMQTERAGETHAGSLPQRIPQFR